MSYEEGLKYEQSGDYFSAMSTYRQELDWGRVTKDAVRGLFRSTLKVGDIYSLTLELSELCRTAGIGDGPSKLMLGRLLIEIGEIERSREAVNDINSKSLSTSESTNLDLLNADILALDFRFDEAIELLSKSYYCANANYFRRIAELEIAAQRPKNAILALKRYVDALNRQNESQANAKRFITASGFIFNMANQMWLEQDFPEAKDLPSLSESMKVLQEVIQVDSNPGDEDLQSCSYESFNTITSESYKETSSKSRNINSISEVKKIRSKGKTESGIEALIEFLNVPAQSVEFSRSPLQNWETHSVIKSESHFFAIEESGLAVWSNFKICPSCNFVAVWSQALKSSKISSRRDFLSHNYPEAILTQLLAREVENRTRHTPKLITRWRLRQSRVIPGRYIRN